MSGLISSLGSAAPLPSLPLLAPLLDEIQSTLQTIGSNSLSVASDGVTATLSNFGTSVSFPTLALSSATQSGAVTFPDGTHFITGTDAGETISGTSENDAIYALGGNDFVMANAGHDYVFGGAGSDTIYGGDGNDHLYGYSNLGGPDGADMILGDAGDDYIQGNAGNDVLNGGEGNDRVVGGADNDVVWGGVGNDALNGNFGNDTLDGGDGDDVVRGGKGDDIVSGGSGDDHIYGDLGADRLTGGSGTDVFHFAGNDAAVLSTDTLTGHLDTITDFQAGVDRVSLGFTPAEVIQGAVQDSVASALTYATSILSGHDGAVAAVGVGSDTYLFYSSGGGVVVDSAIDVQNTAPSSLNSSIFI